MKRRRIALGVPQATMDAIDGCRDQQVAAKAAFDEPNNRISRLWAERANELSLEQVLTPKEPPMSIKAGPSEEPTQAFKPQQPQDGLNHGPLSHGIPVPLMVHMFRFLAHHGQETITQQQQNQMIAGLCYFDWNGYVEPDAHFLLDGDS